jgi:outer membrane receptor protein involved in Fe transport
MACSRRMGLFTYPDFARSSPTPPVETQVAYGQPVLRFKENDLGLYFQDDWRVKDNLTLNLGLRWEFYQQASNLLHDESVAQQTGSNPLWDTSLPLSLTTVPKLPNQYHNFGPVVGFAWTPRILGNDQTVFEAASASPMISLTTTSPPMWREVRPSPTSPHS